MDQVRHRFTNIIVFSVCSFFLVLPLPMEYALGIYLLSKNIDFCFVYCLTNYSLNCKTFLITQVPFATDRKLICFSLSKSSSWQNGATIAKLLFCFLEKYCSWKLGSSLFQSDSFKKCLPNTI